MRQYLVYVDLDYQVYEQGIPIRLSVLYLEAADKDEAEHQAWQVDRVSSVLKVEELNENTK